MKSTKSMKQQLQVIRITVMPCNEQEVAMLGDDNTTEMLDITQHQPTF